MNRYLPELSIKSVVIILFLLIIPALLLYNLSTTPRPWHDEGNVMLLARALAEDGVYAVKTSTGFQTFGVVQSVGPTIILPVALSYKFFGVGVLQGRLIAILYTFLTLVFIFKLTGRLFGTYSAILGLLLLLGSASSQILYFGRQTLGEVPALGFFLAGWYFWWVGRERKKTVYFGVAGLLIGLSMVTKSTYVIIGGGVLGIVTLLDLIYYRQRFFISLVLVGAISLVIFSLWVLFQRQYYGAETFQTNLSQINQLGQSTTGLSITGLMEGAKFLIGFKNEYFYFLWGIPSLVYALFLCIRKDEQGFLASVVTIFSVLWLLYYFYSVPWPAYLFAPSAIVALFSGKLLIDLAFRLRISYSNIVLELKSGLSDMSGLFIAFSVALLIFVFYPLQNAVQFNVLNKDDGPKQVADFLKNKVESDAVIETWERELGILTDFQFHYPDQSYLIKVHATKYRSAPQDYLLGYDYFDTIKPSYVVIGRFAREFPIYDSAFLTVNTTLIYQVGQELTSYEIYKINYPLVDNK